MSIKQYQQVRAAIAVFIGMIVSFATVRNSMVLAVVAVVTGMLFLSAVRAKVKIVIDEREQSVRQQAAQWTYAIFAPTLGLGSFVLFMFARDEYYYIEALAMVFSYLTLFLIALYAISYHFLNRKYGGKSDEE